jgi:hypothetical protein
MGPHRQEHTVSAALPRRQTGITALGFLILATIFGLVGFGGIKLAPLYMQKMRIGTVLEDVKAEFDGTNVNTGNLRRTIVQRLYIEGIRVREEDVIITPSNTGFNVSLRYDNQTSFIGDISFLVAIDEQIEIMR